jgi:hypothetical protein
MAPSPSPFRALERSRNPAERRDVASVAVEVPPEFEIYARSPDLTEQTLAEAMSALRHLGDGVWNLIQVLEGSLLVRLDAAAAGGPVLLSPGRAAAIPPGTRYYLRFVDPGRCYIEFHVRKEKLEGGRFPAGRC